MLNGLPPVSGFALGRSVLVDVAERIRLLPVLLPGGSVFLYSGLPSGLDGHAEATGAACMIGMCAGNITRAASKLARGSSVEDYKEALFKPDPNHVQRISQLHSLLPQSLETARFAGTEIQILLPRSAVLLVIGIEQGVAAKTAIGGCSCAWVQQACHLHHHLRV